MTRKRSRYKYSDEEISYVREIAPGRRSDEITEMFNKKFNDNLTKSQIASIKTNHGIRSNVPTGQKGVNKRFNEEQETFIRENVKGLHNQELADLVNKEFGLKVTAGQILTYKTNYGLKSGIDATFKKGQKAWNKGMKGLDLAGVNGKKTQFKKGHRPFNYRPVGSERVCTKDGYILIKVQEEGRHQERWKLKHRLIWEEAHGPVPEGHALLFADQDKTNVSLDNLILISRAQLAKLNQMDLLRDSKEANKLGLTMADIYLKIGERNRKDDEVI